MKYKKQIGYVHWFDELSQEGVIHVFGMGGVYFNNEHGKTRYDLKDWTFVLCDIVGDCTFTQVTKIEFMDKKDVEDFISDKLVQALDSGDDSEVYYWTRACDLQDEVRK